MRRSVFHTWQSLAMVVWIGCAAFAQAPPAHDGPAAPQRADLLARVRVRAISNLERQPNYTCTETIERSQRLKSAQKFESLDTIRLEVALVDGKEMFGWPGAKKFEDTDLRKFVSQGAIANGSFAMYERGIFGRDAATFEYAGTGSTGDQPWVRFRFRVPLERSAYLVQSPQHASVVAYQGSFDADPQSLDLKRLEVNVDESDKIPPELLLRQVVTIVEYARMQIGSGEFLLPSGSELYMANADGSEDRNRTHFASCREFTGESVVTFDDPPTTSPDTRANDAPANVEEIELPGDLGLTLVLLDGVDLTKAAIGDPVRARLQNDLKSKGRVLLAKGAIATGRITRMERHGDSLTLGLMFDELEAPPTRARARLRIVSVPTVERFPPYTFYAQSTGTPGEGVIRIRAGVTRLNRGLLMKWSTER